jgi:DNA-binding NtrC family response regulator
VIEPGDLWMNPALSGQATAPAHQGPTDVHDDLLSLEDLEKIHIEKVLRFNNWNRVKSAHMLGITPKTLYLKIKRYRIKIGGLSEQH